MRTGPQTYDLSLLECSAEKWKASPALRAVYADLFAEMRRQLVAGTVLEIGSGIGMARDYFPGLVTSDVVATRFVDRAVSAYAIPPEQWGNVIAFDMLHHLQEPLRFFASAAAALASGGRLILVEPAGTWWGRTFYGWFHPEPCEPDAVQPPYRFPADATGGFANMGMAHALFGPGRPGIAAELHALGLGVEVVRYRDVLAYPATGGFSHRAALPAPALRGLLAVERLLPQAVLRVLALRMLVVLTRKSPP